MTTAPRPGWYPDPAGSDELLRWWDGQDWTDRVSNSAAAPPPLETENEAGSHSWLSSDERVSRSRSALRPWLALGSAFAVFLAAGLGVGLMIWREPGARTADLSSGATTPRAVAGVRTAPVGRLDESTGVATIGPASMTLPGSPYELYDDPVAVRGVLDAFFVANASVHDDYDGSHSWSATVGLAHLSPELASESGLQQPGSRAMLRLSRELFGGHRTTVRRLSSSERSVDGHPGALFTADVYYAIPHLPSRFDTVSALMVRLDDGSLVLAVSSVPNDASPQVKDLAAASLGTLTVS